MNARRLKNTAGWLSLLCMLALSSTGVRIEPVSDPAPLEAPAGPVAAPGR